MFFPVQSGHNQTEAESRHNKRMNRSRNNVARSLRSFTSTPGPVILNVRQQRLRIVGARPWLNGKVVDYDNLARIKAI